MFGTVETVLAVLLEEPLVGLLRSVPRHRADDVVVEDMKASREYGGSDEEVYGAGPQVRLDGPQTAEPDGGEGHEAKIEGVIEAPILMGAD